MARITRSDASSACDWSGLCQAQLLFSGMAVHSRIQSRNNRSPISSCNSAQWLLFNESSAMICYKGNRVITSQEFASQNLAHIWLNLAFIKGMLLRMLQLSREYSGQRLVLTLAARSSCVCSKADALRLHTASAQPCVGITGTDKQLCMLQKKGGLSRLQQQQHDSESTSCQRRCSAWHWNGRQRVQSCCLPALIP